MNIIVRFSELTEVTRLLRELAERKKWARARLARMESGSEPLTDDDANKIRSRHAEVFGCASRNDGASAQAYLTPPIIDEPTEEQAPPRYFRMPVA